MGVDFAQMERDGLMRIVTRYPDAMPMEHHYVERFGEMLRSIAVLKMRGSRHDSRLREFTIDGAGMHIGEPFRDVSGILSGVQTFVGSGNPAVNDASTPHHVNASDVRGGA